MRSRLVSSPAFDFLIRGTAAWLRPRLHLDLLWRSRPFRRPIRLSVLLRNPYNLKFARERDCCLCLSFPRNPSRDRMKVRAGIEVSSQSDIGCVRQNNEDSFGYWEPEDDRQFLRKGRLAIVADGMGGYEGGQEASRLAVETLVAVYRDFSGDDPQAALVQALQVAHEQILQYSFAHAECGAWERHVRRWRSSGARSITCMLATPGFT